MSIRQTVHIETNEWQRWRPYGGFAPPDRIEIDPLQARAAALLRYRGMEREAQLALQLANVECLVRTVEAVFEGLDSMTEYEARAESASIGPALRGSGFVLEATETVGTVSEQIKLVETVLERALTRLRWASASTSPPTLDGAS